MADTVPPVRLTIKSSRTRRYARLVCGWSNVGLGLIGAVVPGMPTTIFLIIALWAFSQSSPRMQAWLYNHPRYGAPLQAWERHRVMAAVAMFILTRPSQSPVESASKT